MAKYCAFCGKKLGVFDWGFSIENSDYEYCSEHWRYISWIDNAVLSGDSLSIDECIDDFKNSLERFSDNFDDALNMLLQKCERAKRLELEREQSEKELEEKENMLKKLEQTLLLTTGNAFDGYKVEKYIDVICEEVVFKNSFANQLGAELENLGGAFSFKERELTGSRELVKNARSYVMKKFRRSAAELGANAILGVDFENSFGDKVVRVSVSGTAVVISKKE